MGSAKNYNGVPQGSILGPDCFSINVNDMPSIVNSQDGTSEIDLFADDCNAFVIGDSVDEVLTKIQTTANNLHHYTNKNTLTIHPEKCNLMILSRTKFTGPQKEVKLDNKPITAFGTCKCLGLTIDNELTFTSHVSKVCKSFSLEVKSYTTCVQCHKMY